MASNSLVSGNAEWHRDTNAMLVSACCHFSMLIVVALVSVAGGGGGVGEKIVVSLGKGDDSGVSPIADDMPLAGDGKADNTSPLEAERQIEAALGPATPAEQSPLFSTAALATKGEIDVGPLVLPASPSAKGGSVGGLAAAGDPGELSGLGGKGRGGGRTGEGSYGKKATEFFGIGGYGQSFVYVVDCSGSMGENGKFDRARYELLQSIEQLTKEQSYFVIFYNHQSHPMDGGRLVLATPARITETTQWVNFVEPDGGTNPLPALLYALSLHPDAIYFLSDGQFDPGTIQEIKVRNRPNNRLKTRQVPIHTIAFYDRFAAGLMRQIARNSGGEFKFVQ